MLRPPEQRFTLRERVIPHAALLRQACAHCGKFLAAASRRSRGRVSVPVWLIILSDQLPIIALGGRDPPNQLIGRSPLHRRPRRTFAPPPHSAGELCGITPRFRGLPPAGGQVGHVFLTRPPRSAPEGAPVRLACIRHAASVDPEPGSNSPPSSPLPCRAPGPGLLPPRPAARWGPHGPDRVLCAWSPAGPAGHAPPGRPRPVSVASSAALHQRAPDCVPLLRPHRTGSERLPPGPGRTAARKGLAPGRSPRSMLHLSR